MSSKAARIVAHAIRRGAQRHEQRVGPRVYRGRITSLSPLSVDLLGQDMQLDDYDIELGQDVIRYNISEGLEVGDTLGLIEVEEGDWMAVTVASDHRVYRVADTEPATP